MHVKNKYFRKLGFLNQMDVRSMREHANRMIKELDIRCTGPQQLTRQLSGGNQQKVCIARALTLDPNVLFVSEPTRGIDIGAKKLVLDLLVKLNKELGMTIVMTSSELIELRSICDRIAIISGGKVEGILRPDDSDRDFGLMMAGEYKKMKDKEAM
jgi:simple sugar transport system ATP-binding protein